MNELWKKLSVPSKFKTDSKNNYRMKGKTTVIWGSTNRHKQLNCKQYEKRLFIIGCVVSINEMR